jgi:hypothetical protein
MRILAISDIHENVEAVRLLRKSESNRFDAIVIAGDIGDGGMGTSSPQEILGILETFACPVLYVYGNWDHRLAYDQSFGTACKHLHLSPVQCGCYSFVGFSGLPTNWGRNPIAEKLYQEVENAHRAAVDRYRECKAAAVASQSEIESTYAKRVEELNSRTRDRQKSAYRAKLRRLEEERDRQIRKTWSAVEKVMNSKEYKAYGDERRARKPEIAIANRRALVGAITGSGTDPRRAIVVTHERLARTSEDLAGVPLFLFGHQHGFADTLYKGARFVNVSALDRTGMVQPADKRRTNEDDYCNINMGNFVIIDAGRSLDFGVRCVPFEPKFEKWKLVSMLKSWGSPYVE